MFWWETFGRVFCFINDVCIKVYQCWVDFVSMEAPAPPLLSIFNMDWFLARGKILVRIENDSPGWNQVPVGLVSVFCTWQCSPIWCFQLSEGLWIVICAGWSRNAWLLDEELIPSLFTESKPLPCLHDGSSWAFLFLLSFYPQLKTVKKSKISF